MENIKRILSYTRRAVDDYEMISEGDRIAVGVSVLGAFIGAKEKKKKKTRR